MCTFCRKILSFFYFHQVQMKCKCKIKQRKRGIFCRKELIFGAFSVKIWCKYSANAKLVSKKEAFLQKRQNVYSVFDANLVQIKCKCKINFQNMCTFCRKILSFLTFIKCKWSEKCKCKINFQNMCTFCRKILSFLTFIKCKWSENAKWNTEKGAFFAEKIDFCLSFLTFIKCKWSENAKWNNEKGAFFAEKIDFWSLFCENLVQIKCKCKINPGNIRTICMKILITEAKNRVNLHVNEVQMQN